MRLGNFSEGLGELVRANELAEPLPRVCTELHEEGHQAFECLLLCAEKPRTIAELESLTGCPNGRINTALRGLTPWWDAKTETVIRPAMHLLQRRRVINGKGHRYHLTSQGKALLNPASSAES